jgi:hypothetical protein
MDITVLCMAVRILYSLLFIWVPIISDFMLRITPEISKERLSVNYLIVISHALPEPWI